MAEIKFVSVQSPSIGTVIDNGDGSVTFTPPTDFQGAARFEYTITDGGRTGTGFVYISVEPPLIAGDIVARMEKGGSVTLTEVELLANNSGPVHPSTFSGEPDPVG